jgi:hypothetical protein
MKFNILPPDFAVFESIMVLPDTAEKRTPIGKMEGWLLRVVEQIYRGTTT